MFMFVNCATLYTPQSTCLNIDFGIVPFKPVNYALKKLTQKFYIFMKTTAFVHFLYEIYQIQCHMNHDFQKLCLILFLEQIIYFILF